MISLEPVVSFAAISSSSSARLIAMMPARRGFEYASTSVFLIVPLARDEHDEARRLGREVADAERGLHLLAVLQREQVHERLAARGAPELRKLPHLLPVDAAAVGEEQHRRVRGRDEQVLDEVFVLRLHADLALPPRAARGTR